MSKMTKLTPGTFVSPLAMSSTSASSYRRNCQAYLDSVASRPSMYFRSLNELQAIMNGHQVAFQQLGLIGNDESFHDSFTDWLTKTSGVSDGAAGWAFAVEAIAGKQDLTTNAVFFDLVGKFFDHWLE